MNAQTRVARPGAGQADRTAVTAALTSSVTGAVTAAVTVGAVLLALVTLYAVFLDQGALLTPVMGKTATTMNYLHELVHDGRHLLGAPCH